MELVMPHAGGEPISNRIAAGLIREMKNGMFAGCKVLPSEIELASRLGVSRSVIRDALGSLEREGFIERIRGVGTVIHRNIVGLTTRLDLKYEYNELIRGMGCQPFTDSVRVRLEPASGELAGRLGMDTGAALIVCEKRLLAGKTPVIYSIDRLPLSLLGDIPYETIDWSQPVFNILEQERGIPVDTDIANISAVTGTPDVRRRLQAAEGEALLLIDEVGYFKLTNPILQTYGFYTNFFEFTMLRKRF